MNPMLRHLLPLGLLGLLIAPLHAQDQATTLLAGCDKAAVVVRATVLAATDPSPEWHRVEFRTDEVLRGDVGATFAVLEPAGACCGRSLFALQPGNACLLFLQRTGATLHPFGGARGVLADSPLVAAHVRALLTANGNAARTQVLVAGLASTEPRVAADAAHSLAGLPVLQLGATAREAVVTALGQSLQHGNAAAASLIDVAVRLESPSMLDAVLPLYLGEARPDRRTLLRQALSHCSAAGITDRLPMHLHGDEDREMRAAELLADMPTDDVRPVLQGMLNVTRSPRVQLCVCESLLATGTAAAALQGSVPPVVLQLAERRRATQKVFRNLRPQQR